MYEALDLVDVEASFRGCQVIEKSVIGSYFEAFKVLLFQEFENDRVIQVEIVFAEKLFMNFLQDDPAEGYNNLRIVDC